MNKPEKCPHCGETGIDYRNFKRHLYMYCVDPLLINETEEEKKKKYLLSIRNGEHKQFVWDKEKQIVKCKCGHNAVFMRTAFVCGTITAYPCKYNK